MMNRKFISDKNDITTDWLSTILKRDVVSFIAETDQSNWSEQIRILVELANGEQKNLRLKICLGENFGPSEVEYYTRDYVNLESAPLVHCWSALFYKSLGYNILLDDLATTHTNRRDILPSLEYGMAIAEALGQMHRHHWQSQPAPSSKAINRYFNEIEPGVAPMEHVTGQVFTNRYGIHKKHLQQRLSDFRGMSLLHGDLNSMNILTPQSAEKPVYFIDRQPFEWSLTYSIAVYDLAYCLVLWWPEHIRATYEAKILRHWYEQIGDDTYTWHQTIADWRLAVEQCIHVPMEWCSKSETVEKMRWLWEIQLKRVNSSIESSRHIT
ncbi:phosphotransferase [Agrobacterium vitis]